MARTAKRYKNVIEGEREKFPIYKAGIYARLSADHDKRKSGSIETQVEMIKALIRRHNEDPQRKYGFEIQGIYWDLGKTGADFDRPGFQQLMGDVQKGKINCIFVKDFSRFGRNYIETGNYLENLLTFFNVRFISVCDHYDSFAPDAKDQELSVHIKNMINDAYAKDISAKEKAAKRSGQKRGDYVGGLAPYGYSVKKEGGLHKLAVDEKAAMVVRRIFHEYTDGKSVQQIIDGLWKDRIHRPSDYRKYRHVHCQEGESLGKWGISSIGAVLTRDNYCGDLVQHKYESKFLKGEKGDDLLDEDQWIITPGTHEAIVNRDVFEKARERRNRCSTKMYVKGNEAKKWESVLG